MSLPSLNYLCKLHNIHTRKIVEFQGMLWCQGIPQKVITGLQKYESNQNPMMAS